MAAAMITAVHGEKGWAGVRKLVKEDKSCPHDSVQFFPDLALFAEPIPMKLAVTVNGNIVAHSEIRDLGTADYGIRVAGLSNTIVTPGYRHHGIYTSLIVLRNLILDYQWEFYFVAARVKRGYEERYMGLYPKFVRVKEQDAQGASWIVRSIRNRAYTDEMLAAAVQRLEAVGKW